MLMLKYPLYDFITTVPSCVETTPVSVVMEIFAQQQCANLVVLDEQQYPLGLLTCTSLLPLLAADGQKSLDQQPLKKLATSIQPIQPLPHSYSVEEFGLFLRSQHNLTNLNLNWALIDAGGKYQGLVDSLRLWQFWMKHRHELSGEYTTSSKAVKHVERHKTAKTPKPVEIKPSLNKPLVQLLERLPWPLMLQTSTGEIVTQNPAWWQQLGALKDPEGVRQQVSAILTTAPTQKTPPTIAAKTQPSGKGKEYNGFEHQSLIAPEKHLQPEQTKTSSQCFIDGIGTCTCVVEVQNGQERVWQFAKIPLDSPELKILNPEFSVHVGKRNTTKEEKRTDNLWLMLATDVTEQQQLYKELAAKNADLIQLNRLKDEFLACISHELKTPLTAVLGLSRLLVDQQLGELNERQARYAGLIHQSGRHLMSVVNDILDLTRMETGQMELTLSKAKIRSVCDRALSEAKAIRTQSSKSTLTDQTPEHQFTLSIEPGLNEIVADEMRLRQMLVHLLSNAFKFTETGGEIGLSVSRWEGWITFTIWDTGIGIPEHQQHLIFQKFQQLENPLTRQFEGTGLGLVLTRALARLHGGDVSFLSKEGKGSQFTLLLPPSPPNNRVGEKGSRGVGEKVSRGVGERSRGVKQTAPISTLQTHHNSLVLVVETVGRYIEDLTEQLTALGYRVVIARSGCEAVEKARRLQPKAIFLNPLLPLLSGWDVLTLIKSDVATRHIPVLMTATGAEKEQAFAHRADGFLRLPIQHQVLATLLESFFATPTQSPQKLESDSIPTKNPLRILRLVNPEWESSNGNLSLPEHRVIEVDDLEQAELMARVWQFDILLLDAQMPAAEIYLQKLTQYSRIAALPLVTCSVATTQAASQVPGLSVFPCLAPLSTDKNSRTDALLSVLQIAAGVCCPPNILVVDFSILPDLPTAPQPQRGYRSHSLPTDVTPQGLQPLTISRGSKWFQALIQYLQTAGFKAAMSKSWAELLQQIRHQSVDLLLINLEKSALHEEVLAALSTLKQLPLNLPPILALVSVGDQDIEACPVQILNQFDQHNCVPTEIPDAEIELIETVLGGIATKILPRSLSVEELLNQINLMLRT